MARTKKVSTTIYLEPDQDAALRALAKRTRVPAAAFVREGVAVVLERYRDAQDGHPVGAQVPAEPTS